MSPQARRIRRKRRSHGPVRRSFLYRPWVYLALGGVAAVLYAWPLLSGAIKPQKPPVRVTAQETAPTEFWTQELDSAKALEAFRRRPVLSLLLGVWSSVVLAFGMVGILLTVQAVQQRRLARLFRYRPKLRRFWALREVLWITVLLGLAVSLLPFAYLSLIAWGASVLADPHLRSLITTLILDVLALLIIWAFASTKAPSPAAVLGLVQRRPARAVGQGLVGYIAMFPWMFGLLWFIIRTCQRLGIQPPIEPIHELLFLDTRWFVVAMTVFLACVVGPIVEEVFFRGVVFVAVRKHTSRLAAMLASGAAFSAMHTNVIGFLPILILGAFLADLYERTGSLLAPIAVHMLHNVLLVGLGLLVKAILFP